MQCLVFRYYNINLLLYGADQFKLDRTCVWHGLDMIHFFILLLCNQHVYARLMTSNLQLRALVYTLDMFADGCTHVRNTYAKFELCAF